MTFTKDQHGRGFGEESEFQKALLAIAGEHAAEVAKTKAAKDLFEERWKNVRDTVIKPAFKEAEDCLGSKVLNLSCAEENGCSYVLRNANRNSLKYTADQGADRIFCSGPGLDEKVEFELPRLTRDRVESHVKTFIGFCLRHQTD